MPTNRLTSTLTIDIWSDVVCPWCYIGKRNLEAALEGFEEPVTLRWRSFELDPSAPEEVTASLTQILSRKYGMSPARAAQMQAQMTEKAATLGLEFRFEQARTGNTFDAHRLIHLAHTLGLGDAMKERLMRAYFTEGEPIGDLDTLTRLADEAGVPEARARAVLEGGEFGEEVRHDEQLAAEYGASGVPFFVVDGQFGVPGAQPPEALRRVLEHALEHRRAEVDAKERAEAETRHTGEAPGCEGDSCARPE